MINKGSVPFCALGEVFEAFSGPRSASNLLYLTRGLRNLNYEQRQHFLALPVKNTANLFDYAYLKHDQLLLEGVVGPQHGGIFGPMPLPGGAFQAYSESGAFGSVGLIK